jgi:hypothetical protein
VNLLGAIRSLSPRVELQLIRHLTTDLRGPTRCSEWQAVIDAHKRRRARECRKVKPAKYPRPQIAEQSLSQGGRQWRAPVGIPASPVRRALEPTALERWLTAPGMMLRQAD